MRTTASPELASSPAESAAWCPKFREKWITFQRGSERAIRSSSSPEPSRLASSTKTTSKRPPVSFSRSGARRCWSASRFSRSS